jgi:hypothetical protein
MPRAGGGGRPPRQDRQANEVGGIDRSLFFISTKGVFRRPVIVIGPIALKRVVTAAPSSSSLTLPFVEQGQISADGRGSGGLDDQGVAF